MYAYSHLILCFAVKLNCTFLLHREKTIKFYFLFLQTQGALGNSPVHTLPLCNLFPSFC